MPTETQLTYRLTLKPTGGLWLLFSDRTLIDVDMTGDEMRDLARLMLEHADFVDRASLGAPRTKIVKAVPKCQ